MLRFSALDGALLALALAAGAWGASVAGLFRHPVREAWPSYVLALAAMVALGAAAGWLTARWDRGVDCLFHGFSPVTLVRCQEDAA